MRTRAAILSMLVFGFLLSTTGAGLAVSGLSDNNQASSAQYGRRRPDVDEHPRRPARRRRDADHDVDDGADHDGAPTDDHGAGRAGPRRHHPPAPSPACWASRRRTSRRPSSRRRSSPRGATPPSEVQPARQVRRPARAELPFTGFAALPVLLAGLAAPGRRPGHAPLRAKD